VVVTTSDTEAFELRRQACMILPQLPDDKKKADKVICYLRQLLDQVHAPEEPTSGSVLRLHQEPPK
jgi:hypothetical protein